MAGSPRPLPGALVVNIGELLELASDGYLKLATLHRVVSPLPGYRASPAPSSWRQGWMRLCHCLASPRAGGAGRRAPERSRQPALLSGGENVLKGGCAPTRMWRPATMQTSRSACQR